jgi:hypothetical protein
VTNPLERFQDRYGLHNGHDGPILYVREVLGVEVIDPWQLEALEAYASGERRMALPACHGPGKTAFAAWLANYQLDCVYPQLTAATAPSKGQMEDALLKEVKLWFKMRPKPLQDLYDVKMYKIEFLPDPENNFFTAMTARAEKPEALQGKHTADGGKVLLIVDEASGVDEGVFRSGRGSMSQDNAVTLMLSNPTRSTGYFFNACESDRWWVRRVSHEDSPRVSDDFVEEVKEEEGEDSDEFRIRCLGLFPKTDSDTVISWELVDQAQNRDIAVPPGQKTIWGLDVARFGDDRTVLIERSNLHVSDDIEWWQGADLMVTVGKVKAKWDARSESDRPQQIFVDAIGLGSGVVDRLRELGLPAYAVNVSETASANDKYFKVRDEVWYDCRDWLRSGATKLPTPDPDADRRTDPARILGRELTQPKYTFRSGGQRVVESKSDLKKRTKKSPDFADALCLTFAGPAASILHGSAGSSSWNEPIKRKLAMV